MPLPCPHCDQPDLSLLRLVFIGEILRADAPLLVLLTDLMQTCGLLPLSAAAAEPAARCVRRQPGTRPALRLVAAPDQGRGGGKPPSRQARSRPPRPRGVPKQR